MMWMLRRRKRKKMKMLRRKTDPKTGKHTSREPAQSKCTRTKHKSYYVWKFKFTGKVPYAKPATVLCKPAQSKYTWTCQKRHFVRTFTEKMPDASPGASVLCEPAQSKCTWTRQKKAFCVSLRSRNAHGYVTRSILCGNLQGKCRTLPIPPRSITGP